jgi:fermentation-respiration switch protein FrsA (DUF1100 family)
MGAASAIKAAEYEPNLCDALVIDSSFANLKDAIYHGFHVRTKLPYYPFLPTITKIISFFANCDIDKMSTVEYLKKIKQPIFFIHSCVDSVVSPNDSILMYSKSLSEKTRLWIAPKCEKHGGLRKKFAQLYKKKIEKFLELV